MPTRLRVRAFRNLQDADLELPAAGCVVVGRNGHGKTNLIEALLYGETFRSFRGARDAELVRFGADGFRVETDRVAAGYDARTRKKKVTVDGAEPERLADAIGQVRGVVLSPGDVGLVVGEPRERRRYLDVLLALTVPGYVGWLTTYRRSLRQRSRARPQEAPPFERLLAGAGARIWEARRRWTDEWREGWAHTVAALGEAGGSEMAFAPRAPAGDLTEDALRSALEAGREHDRLTGRTSVGPHRDELRLLLEGRPLRRYGSAGQQRTAAIALRLVATDALARRGAEVTLCLDDAFAELDERRGSRLGELIAARAGAGCQIVAAVPKETEIPDVVGSLPRWRMCEGTVS